MADALLLCFGWWVLAFLRPKKIRGQQLMLSSPGPKTPTLSLHSRCPFLSFFTKSFGLSKTIRIFVDN
jgi:hypothetical protein